MLPSHAIAWWRDGPVACHAMPDRFSDRSPDHPSEEELAAMLPEGYRLEAVLNANPLHVDRSGTVSD